MLFLLVVCLAVLLAGYGIYYHNRNKTKAPSELRTGVQVLTDPESLVKDLEK